MSLWATQEQGASGSILACPMRRTGVASIVMAEVATGGLIAGAVKARFP